MAKLINKPMEATDIEEYISNEGDFNFEIEILNLFKRRGLNATHGGTYIDPVTKKPRQYDIRALYRKDMFTLRLAVECKNLRKNFPLLISQLPREDSEAYYEILCSIGKEANSSGLDFANTKNLKLPADNFLYSASSPVGKSTVQVGRTEQNVFHANDTEVYEKWAQAVSSSYDLLSDSTDDYAHTTNRAIGFSLILPVLVVPDDTLWCIDYDKTGKRTSLPLLSEHASIYLDADISSDFITKYTVSHLEIYTKSYLAKWLDSLISGPLMVQLFPFATIQSILRNTES